MDLSVISISAIIIAICLLPVIISSRKQKKKKQQLKSIISEIANKKGLKIQSYEISSSVVIGLTENDDAFVFYKKHENGTEERECILLGEIKKCNLVKTNRASSSGNIGKLLLTFESYDRAKPDIILEFFDASESFLLRGELELVEKWKPLIDAGIASKSTSRKTVIIPKVIKANTSAKMA